MTLRQGGELVGPRAFASRAVAVAALEGQQF
jgi:hypothetical protein